MIKLKTIALLAILSLVSYENYAQKYISKSSSIRFFSSAPLEDIEATTNTSKSVLDMSTGNIAFSVNIQDFQFDKSLMQEHFNEKYMESETYPKATFKGKIIDFLPSAGKQNVLVKGQLTIHGVTNEVEINGDLTISENRVSANSVFMVKLEDYDVKIPSILFQNIAEEVEVTIKFDYKPYDQ